MGINREELLTNELDICENCEWKQYSEAEGEHLKCLLDGKEKGLVHSCDKFIKSTGNHVSV